VLSENPSQFRSKRLVSTLFCIDLAVKKKMIDSSGKSNAATAL
jgi:hypothetical protein